MGDTRRNGGFFGILTYSTWSFSINQLSLYTCIAINTVVYGVLQTKYFSANETLNEEWLFNLTPNWIASKRDLMSLKNPLAVVACCGSQYHSSLVNVNE
jgi:hypothetical protein